MAEAHDNAGVIAFPPLIFLGFLVTAILLEWIAPAGFLPPAFSFWAVVPGFIFYSVAAALAGSAILMFKRAGTHIEPHKPSLVLVEGGPYRLTRNPMYLGLILVLVGCGFVASLDWALPLVIPFGLVLHHGVVLREERYLGAKFGAPYRAYLDSTRRWLL